MRRRKQTVERAWLPSLPVDPPQRRRPRYRRPDTLAAAATSSAIAAWVTLATIGLTWSLAEQVPPWRAGSIVTWFFLAPVFALLGVTGVVAAFVAAAATLATFPLAVAWLRSPRPRPRSLLAGGAVVHAVVAWVALAAGIGRVL